MGTWDATPFGNDAALDWLSDLKAHHDGQARVAAVLECVQNSVNPEAPEAEAGLAAAAVVAAAATQPIGSIIADAREWIVESGFAPDEEVLDAAARAIAVIREDSGLRELWSEAGKLKTWLKEVEKLSDRIEQARATGVPPRRPRRVAPRSLHKMVALHALKPDQRLRERIRAKVAALGNPDEKTPDTDFETPLVLMARHGLLEETDQLLARGADPKRDGGRAFQFACLRGHVAVADALRRAGATVFHEHRVEPGAAFATQVEIANVEEPAQGHRYCLALFSVARSGAPATADYLRGLGANIEQTDLNGETLLHKAAEGGNVPMIHYLIDAGLDPDRVKRKSGESALHYAARAGKLESVRALLERGAIPNVIHSFRGEVHQWDETPFDVADSEDVRKLLKTHGGRKAKDVVSGTK